MQGLDVLAPHDFGDVTGPFIQRLAAFGQIFVVVVSRASSRLDMPEQAKEYYQKVIKSHPDSRAAKRASEMLKKLKG